MYPLRGEGYCGGRVIVKLHLQDVAATVVRSVLVVRGRICLKGKKVNDFYEQVARLKPS